MKSNRLVIVFALLLEWLGLSVISLLCGYGERPFRAVAWFIGLVIFLAMCYFLFGDLKPSDLANCFYYSLVSSTALGYGAWAAEPSGWVKYMGAVESAFGTFLMALFLTTFTRKITR